MKNTIKTKDLDNYMLMLGFRENLSGTEMLRLAVKEWEPGMGITKELYPMIARKCGSTPSRVERCMRHAIESAFERGSVGTIMSLFGYTLNPEKCSPTVSEFVARMSVVCRDED